MSRYHSKNSNKYEFSPPPSLRQAKARLREITINIMNVEKQLGDRRREKNMSVSEYETWREKTKAAKIFMVAEQWYLKDWIFDRRRMLESQMAGVWPHNDLRTLLQRAVVEGRAALNGDKHDLASVLDLADLYLTHEA